MSRIRFDTRSLNRTAGQLFLVVALFSAMFGGALLLGLVLSLVIRP